MKGKFNKVVLAYSGGLDTSVILGWLIDEGYDVHAVYVDLGQPCEDREAILQKARDIGARSARQRSLPGGSTITTVEPMLKRPISWPFSRLTAPAPSAG